jgi:hypothetical protein
MPHAACRMPHAAFRGQTPDEVFFGRGEGIPDHLAAGHRRASEARLAENRRLTCDTCDAKSPLLRAARDGLKPLVISSVLQLPTLESRMS